MTTLTDSHPGALSGGSHRLVEDRAEPPASATAISVEGLVKHYGASRAVDGVTFAVPRGTITGLLGGNGAGKTTTLAMIMGLVRPTAGRVTVLGHDMARGRERVLDRMNFESPYAELPHRLTVRQNLSIFARLYGVQDVKARLERLAEEFDLKDVLDRAAGRLSAGQKTRVSLAKALVNDPEVLLLDEPTSSLDPDTAEWVRTRIEHYRNKGTSILLASHNMREVERLCDSVVVLKNGMVAETGTPGDLMQRFHAESLDPVFIAIARR